jgi:outer membrane protein TolC
MLLSMLIGWGALAAFSHASASKLSPPSDIPAPPTQLPLAQVASDSSLARAVVRAVETSARLRAARARLNAAQARVGPAGARPDPMLMAGIQNLPATAPGFGEEMTMKMIGITQTISRGGKLSLSRAAVQRDVEAVRATVIAESLSVVADANRAYLDVALADRTLALLERTHGVLTQLVAASDLRYRTVAGPTGGQSFPSPARSAVPMAASAPVGGMSTPSMPASSPSPSAGSGMSAGMGSQPPTPVLRTAPQQSTARTAAEAMPTDPMAAPSMSQGSGSLADLLTSRQTLVRLGERVATARSERVAALARFNGLIGVPSDSSLSGATVPERLARAAIAPLSQIRFESLSLGSLVSDSPLPSLSQLEHLSHARSPELRAHEAMIKAQALRVELARKARVPDIDLSIEYGQRDHMPDMITARVSVPLQLHRSERQQQGVVEAQADLAALHADHEERIRDLHAQVATLHGTLERDRTQLALYRRAILPEGERIAEARALQFAAGKSAWSDVLQAEASRLEDQLTYERTLVGFAKTLIALEQLIGEEVVP